MDATTVAVDLAKTVFELAIADVQWHIGARQRLNRTQFARFLVERADARGDGGVRHRTLLGARRAGARPSRHAVPPAYVRPVCASE